MPIFGHGVEPSGGSLALVPAKASTPVQNSDRIAISGEGRDAGHFL